MNTNDGLILKANGQEITLWDSIRVTHGIITLGVASSMHTKETL